MSSKWSWCDCKESHDSSCRYSGLEPDQMNKHKRLCCMFADYWNSAWGNNCFALCGSLPRSPRSTYSNQVSFFRSRYRVEKICIFGRDSTPITILLQSCCQDGEMSVCRTGEFFAILTVVGGHRSDSRFDANLEILTASLRSHQTLLQSRMDRRKKTIPWFGSKQ